MTTLPPSHWTTGAPGGASEQDRQFWTESGLLAMRGPSSIDMRADAGYGACG